MHDTTENQEITQMPLIGDTAPSFKAKTTAGKISFPEDYEGKWVILFSHPADFTPVCTTEFMTIATMQDEFRELNTELIGLSIDSIYSHIAWMRTIKEKIVFKGMKNVEINFPIIEDIKMEVSRKYGMVHPNASSTRAVRAVFIISPKSRLKAILYYPLSTGRNMDEIKRIILALQKAEKDKVATPANWQPGDDVIVPPPTTSEEANLRVENQNEDQCLDWFLCLRKDKG